MTTVNMAAKNLKIFKKRYNTNLQILATNQIECADENN